MKANTKLSSVAAAMLLAGTASQAQTIVYDNLSTTPTLGYGEANANNLILGDSLNLTQGGMLSIFGATVYNSTSGGNTGLIQMGTMYVSFYDNTVPYSSGALTNPLLGSAALNWDFTGGGGLPPGYYTTATFDLSSLNIALPQNILVTQEFVETSGNSTVNGGALLSNPVVGSSPNTFYLNSSATPEGLRTIAGNPGQFGYQIQVTPIGPVANPQSISLVENSAANITLSGSDADGDPVTFSVAAPPTNGTLTGTAPNLVYQPNTNYVGPDAFTFVANDGNSNSAPALVSITVNAASAGLIINPIFDSTITSDPNAAAIENTINGAIQVFESLYSDPVTVSILFAEIGSGLGQSQTYIGSISYSDFVALLRADAKTTNDTLALMHVPGGTSNPVNGGTMVTITLPNARALGISASSPTNYDSIISLNMSLINITRTSIDPSKYDLKSVASHEMDEVLGKGSGLGRANISPEDLFRYTSTGSRTYTTSGDNAYFSMDGGVTFPVRYNQNAGGDYGDFWSIAAHSPVRVQDAFGTPGTTPNFTIEPTIEDIIGWDLVGASATTPAPVFQSVTRTNGTLYLTWSSVSGRSYQLQYTTNLSHTVWNDLGSPIVASGATTSTTDSTNPDQQRFYRVALLPGPDAVSPRPSMSEAAAIVGPLSISTRYLRPAPGGWRMSPLPEAK